MLEKKQNIFAGTLFSAFEALRKNIWFLLKLTFKVYVSMFLLLLGLLVGIGGLTAMLAQFNPFSYSQHLSEQGIMSLINTLQYKLSGSSAMHLSIFIIGILLLLCVAFYGIFQLYCIQFANVYDIAFGRLPRGLTYLKGVIKFFPILMLPSIQVNFTGSNSSFIYSSIFNLIWLIFIYYVVFARLFLSLYVYLQESGSLFSSLSKSWALTDQHTLSTLLFALFGFLYQSYTLVSFNSIGMQVVKSMSLFFIAPYFFLVTAYYYRNLIEEKSIVTK